jgi:hypothetical protein
MHIIEPDEQGSFEGQTEILDLPLQHADLIGLQTIAKGGDFP